MDGDLAQVVIAASKNKSLKHLNLGRNLQSTKAKHVAQVMEAIVGYLQVSYLFNNAVYRLICVVVVLISN